jgi:hypothetical protein
MARVHRRGSPALLQSTSTLLQNRRQGIYVTSGLYRCIVGGSTSTTGQLRRLHGGLRRRLFIRTINRRSASTSGQRRHMVRGSRCFEPVLTSTYADLSSGSTYTRFGHNTSSTDGSRERGQLWLPWPFFFSEAARSSQILPTFAACRFFRRDERISS